MLRMLAVQRKGLASSFQFAMKRLIARSSFQTASKLPRRIAWSVMTANHRSTRLSQEALVGVKWSWNRGCSASQARTFGCLCVP